MPKCLVVFCKNRKGVTKGTAFYTLTKERYELWMKALGRNPVTDKVAVNGNSVCSEHFAQDSFFFVGDKKVLKKGAVPTLKLKPEKFHLTWQSHKTDRILLIKVEEPSPSYNLGMSSKNVIENNSTMDLDIAANEVPTSSSKRRKFLESIENISTTDNESLESSQERRETHLKTFYRFKEEDENGLLDIKEIELFENVGSPDDDEVLSEKSEPTSVAQEANQALIVDELVDIKKVLNKHCQVNTLMMERSTAMQEKMLQCSNQVVKTQMKTLVMEEKKIDQHNQVILQMKIQNYLLGKFLEKLG